MESDSYLFFSISSVVSLALIAFFASSQVAFASLGEREISALRKRTDPRSERIQQLLRKSPALFLAIKGGLMFGYFALVISITLLAQHLSSLLGWRFGSTLLAFAGAVMLMLFFVHEIWASRIVMNRKVQIAEKLSWAILAYVWLSRPVIAVLLHLLRGIALKFKLESNGPDHERILAMVENGDQGELEEDERAMIHSIIEFGDTEVHEIMVPRTDMVCVEESTDLQTIISLIKENGHSRLPLFREAVDNILGIIHVKDLLPYSTASENKQPKLTDLARPAYFVPESKKLDLLLKEFQQFKHHMAIVVDEYGGTAGLVTMEDVIEEIVGDIQDEHDKEPPLVRQLDDNTFSVDAKIDLHELNDMLNLDLPTEGDYESLGGFILNMTGYVPDENEVVKHDIYSFEVQKVDRNRIIEVKLTVNSNVTAETGQDIDSN